jgi:hypothetical protein
MPTLPIPAGFRTVTPYLTVPDAQSLIDFVVKVFVAKPANQLYGDRQAELKDPNGITWWVATHIEEAPAEEIARRAKAVLEKSNAPLFHPSTLPCLLPPISALQVKSF